MGVIFLCLIVGGGFIGYGCAHSPWAWSPIFFGAVSLGLAWAEYVGWRQRLERDLADLDDLRARSQK